MYWNFVPQDELLAVNTERSNDVSSWRGGETDDYTRGNTDEALWRRKDIIFRYPISLSLSRSLSLVLSLSLYAGFPESLLSLVRLQRRDAHAYDDDV
jgi:hypothetical protein